MIGGSISCTGDNAVGQLGGGTTASSSATPVVVPSPPRAVGLALGATDTCALTGTKVICWGHGDLGEMGAGTNVTTGPAVMQLCP
jgi:hypothetical protein